MLSVSNLLPPSSPTKEMRVWFCPGRGTVGKERESGIPNRKRRRRVGMKEQVFVAVCFTGSSKRRDVFPVSNIFFVHFSYLRLLALVRYEKTYTYKRF